MSLAAICLRLLLGAHESRVCHSLHACEGRGRLNSLLDGPVLETSHRLCLGMQAGLWVLLSEPYRSAGAALPRAAHSGIKSQTSAPGGTGPLLSAQNHPPPNVSRGGEFCDRVWTVPTEHFNQMEVSAGCSCRHLISCPASDQAPTEPGSCTADLETLPTAANAS